MDKSSAELSVISIQKTSVSVPKIAEQVIVKATDNTRHIVAIAGPPGAGKSTLSETLQQVLDEHGQRSKIVPMDGFHLDNSTLSKRGLLERKGAPDTFDANGFLNLMNRLKENRGDVTIPVFDRDSDSVIADADTISEEDAILIVEGNYLLIQQAPWSKLAEYWDQTIFINPGINVLEERLVQRWLDQGLSPEQARIRAIQNDLANAHYVIEHSMKADIQINN